MRGTAMRTCVWRRVRPSSQSIWPGRFSPPWPSILGRAVAPPEGVSYSPVRRMFVGWTSPFPKRNDLGRMVDGIEVMTYNMLSCEQI